MIQKESMTIAQAMDIRQMAIAKKISRGQIQQGLKDATFAVALEAVKEGRTVILAPKLTPPPGGRIHIVRLPVTLDQPWPKAVKAVGSNTPDSYNVWRVGDLYLPTAKGKRTEEIILVNFGFSGVGNWDKAIAWADQYHLKRTHPRQVFAIGERKPNLNRKLAKNPMVMVIVATEECTFEGYRQACFVWWIGAERGASLRWLEGFGDSCDWFAFSRFFWNLNPVSRDVGLY